MLKGEQYIGAIQSYNIHMLSRNNYVPLKTILLLHSKIYTYGSLCFHY